MAKKIAIKIKNQADEVVTKKDLLQLEINFDGKLRTLKGEILVGVESIVSNIIGATLDKQDDFSKRVSVLEAKVKVLENKN